MDHIDEYLALMERRPGDFAEDASLPLVREKEALLAYERETGNRVGMICRNEPFYYFVGDVAEKNGKRFRYPRILHCNPGSAGGICLVYADTRNGRLFYLHRIFRHGPRLRLWEVPRGFQEREEITPEENIRRELLEESSVREAEVVRLGECRADTSFIASAAVVFAAKVSVDAPAPTYTEGIIIARWFRKDEVMRMLGSEITDAFSLSAFALFGKAEL